jgi:transcriptional regulator GlxA family with amidase domain
LQSQPHKTSVLTVAQKWGFTHTGRFSKYYTELYGENPSLTLKKTRRIIDGMKEQCVERKEEML